MYRTIAIVSLMLLFVSFPTKSKAQQQDKITPLHKFFQTNYDSTIIYHNWSSWYSAPNYIIIAKQKGNVYLFTYTSPYRKLQGRPIPGDLKSLYLAEETKFQKTVPDANRYLLAQNLKQAELQNYWQQLKAQQLWNIKSNKGESANNCMVEDGDENTFYFISKNGIKIAEFYAPTFYEECARENSDRQKAINVIEVLVGALNN